MKSHISATIEQSLVKDLDTFSREEHRTKSQVIEMALRQYLTTRRNGTHTVIATDSSFQGTFHRADCYER